MKNIDELCERNLKLVPYVINRLGLNNRFEDYVDVGWIGLVIGCKKYDENLGFNESTYLTSYIKYFIYNQLKYERKHNVIDNDIISLDYSINDESFIDFIPSDFDIDEEFNKSVIKQAIEECLKEDMDKRKTKVKHSDVIKDLYGINTEIMGAKDICKKYGISHTALHDIRNKFRRNLKKRLSLILD